MFCRVVWKPMYVANGHTLEINSTLTRHPTVTKSHNELI